MIDDKRRRKRVREALSAMTPEQRDRGQQRFADFVWWMVANSGPPGPMGHLADLGYILGRLCASGKAVLPHQPGTRLWILGYHLARFGRPVRDSEIVSVAPTTRDMLGKTRRKLVPYGLVARRAESGGYVYEMPAEALPAGLMDAVYEQSTLTFLYIIQAGEAGPMKIGVSTDVPARLYQLQGNNPQPLRLRGLIPQSRHSQESAIHRQFEDGRIHGEWFQPTPALVEWAAKWAYPARAERWSTSRKQKAWKPIASSRNGSSAPCAAGP